MAIEYKKEFSDCCKATASMIPKTGGFDIVCDRCQNDCQITDLQARILVDQRKDKVYNVTKMFPERNIVNVLIDDEGESFEISYLVKEIELIA